MHATFSPASQFAGTRGRLPFITGKAKHPPESPAEVARLIGAAPEPVAGGVASGCFRPDGRAAQSSGLWRSQCSASSGRRLYPASYRYKHFRTIVGGRVD